MRTIFHEYFPQPDIGNPPDMSAQRPVTRSNLDLWMSFFCRSMGAPIPILQAHAVARIMCSCKHFSLDSKGDHVLACKQHTGATRGHNHVMDVLTQLASNTGYSVRFNHKVSTTAAASNKRGDVKLVNFGLDGYHNLFIDVLICCNHVGNGTVNNGHLNVKMHTNDCLHARAGVKNNQNKADYAAILTA